MGAQKESKKTFSSLIKEQSNKNGWNILEEVIVGIVLGDARLEKAKVKGRLRFEQSDIRTDFFFHVWKYFVFHSSNTPKLRERFDKRTKKVYKTWHFTTSTSAYFTYYYDMFYTDISKVGYKKKIVPINIKELLTPRALAFWIMCDGYKYNAGVALATNSFSISDIELLLNSLNENFGFSCRIIKDHGAPSILIPKIDLVRFQILVIPYMLPTLLYKIHLT